MMWFLGLLTRVVLAGGLARESACKAQNRSIGHTAQGPFVGFHNHCGQCSVREENGGGLAEHADSFPQDA
ncbi:hypothetical protein MESS2_810031 [Mesorhizobium metallidurans STM 2683]|uniref:Uncharacterized protein n=1 Tax=Mesorhizobium metallidurans STM 2683 TaxID=1297569 RepID=M5EXX8_9HYPH|nr:hypothetical protein MESS2_810031 [Mesorhizobium metallidurans STM 2683]